MWKEFGIHAGINTIHYSSNTETNLCFVSGSDELVKFCLSFDSTRFDHQAAFWNTEGALDKFGNLNGDMKSQSDWSIGEK